MIFFFFFQIKVAACQVLHDILHWDGSGMIYTFKKEKKSKERAFVY